MRLSAGDTLLATLVVALFQCGLPAQDRTPYPQPDSKKGLQVQMVDDALALGIRHAALNVDLTALVDLDGGDDALPWQHGGERFWLRRAPIEALDAQVAPLSRAGVVVSAILLACQSGEAARDRLVIHSRCTQRAPNGIAAFATDSDAGRRWLAAAVACLAARYSGKAEHGRIWNWIVGNEVNSHWWWYHLGKADLPVVVDAYESAVRIVHGAVQQHSRHGRVFVSLEHHWSQRYAAGDAQQAAPGRELLTTFAAKVRERGDFDWHVAFHPYPEDLFECRFWRDRSAPDADDAPRVTFRNLPVLARSLAQKDLQWLGASRRVILSEQGFHCRDGEDGERDQAAAFALAWSIVQRSPGIDALILHRHVDHAHEGGLRLGLWTRQADSVCTPGRPRRMADVFAACDTPQWPACAEFTLPVIGIARFEDWPLGSAR
jgi:hypothetical protein